MNLDQGNTSFMLLTAALVLLMTPGLAFFYGGLVKAKSVISMMMMSFGAIGLIAVLWVVYGYAIAFSGAGGPRLRRNRRLPRHQPRPAQPECGLRAGVGFGDVEGSLGFPDLAFAAFQATFAIITVALVSGAIADRAKFGSWMIFAGLWATLVYFPVASWVFNFTLGDTRTPHPCGSFHRRRLADLRSAGHLRGLGVHRLRRWYRGPHQRRCCGARSRARARQARRLQEGRLRPAQPALRAARCRTPVVRLVRLQRRLGAGGRRLRPRSHSSTRSPRRRPRCSPGSSSRSSATARRPRSVQRPEPSRVSSRSPRRARSLHPIWAIVLGVIAGVICALAVDLKFKLGFDDSLDVVGIHLVGGLDRNAVTSASSPTAPGSFFSGSPLAARSPGDRCVRRDDRLLRFAYLIGFVDREDDRLPREERGRGRRHRQGRARRRGLRPRRRLIDSTDLNC